MGIAIILQILNAPIGVSGIDEIELFCLLRPLGVRQDLAQRLCTPEDLFRIISSKNPLFAFSRRTSK